MIKRSKGRKQRYMSVMIQCCVWEEYTNLQKQTPSEKNRPITSEYAELSGIDGEPIEFEWNISQILRHIQKDLKARQINPKQFEGQIIFMLMFKDIDLTKRRNSDMPKK